MNTVFTIFLSLAIVVFVFWAIRKLLAPSFSFADFLVGDSGKYSLSRLQAAVWAVVIIAYQIAVIITLIALGKFSEFNLVFSEETIWLLGLSYGSYITVKGISSAATTTVERAQVVPPSQRKWSDLIASEEGLDLSRFQMLIWTIIAAWAFLNDVETYLSNIKTAAELKPYFNSFGTSNSALLPTVDMSFLVLMGLSQGAYIGRKLVPSHKVAQFREEYLTELEAELSTMTLGIRFKESEFEMIQESTTVATTEKLKAYQELTVLKKKREKMEREIEELRKMKAERFPPQQTS
jgi:hypothetical protein